MTTNNVNLPILLAPSDVNINENIKIVVDNNHHNIQEKVNCLYTFEDTLSDTYSEDTHFEDTYSEDQFSNNKGHKDYVDYRDSNDNEYLDYLYEVRDFCPYKKEYLCNSYEIREGWELTIWSLNNIFNKDDFKFILSLIDLNTVTSSSDAINTTFKSMDMIRHIFEFYDDYYMIYIVELILKITSYDVSCYDCNQCFYNFIKSHIELFEKLVKYKIIFKEIISKYSHKIIERLTSMHYDYCREKIEYITKNIEQEINNIHSYMDLHQFNNHKNKQEIMKCLNALLITDFENEYYNKRSDRYEEYDACNFIR